MHHGLSGLNAHLLEFKFYHILGRVYSIAATVEISSRRRNRSTAPRSLQHIWIDMHARMHGVLH